MSPEQDELLEKLFWSSYRKLVAYANYRLDHSSMAEEVVQDTFHEAVLHIGILMRHPNPSAWLMRTLVNKIHESERMRRQCLRRFVSMDSALPVETASPNDCIEQIVERSAPSLANKLAGVLSKEELYQLKRFVFDGAPHKEIAQELGISLCACQKRMERIWKKLHAFYST